MQKFHLLILIVFTVLSASTVERDGFGTAGNGLWSSLTPFEKETLEKAPDAKTGDADALLAFAVMGSGNVRTKAEFQKIKKSIDAFYTRINRELSNRMSQREKAKLIYDRMFTHFFRLTPGGDRLKGYRFHQSQFTEIFLSEKYNCVSSSLLYTVLLRKYGIKVEGVVVPSHVFVQIITDDGDTIAVETTSKKGFNYKHTKKNVEDKSRGWYERRGLEYYGWEQYLNRKFVSPWKLVLHNYNNQHTARERMAFEDRLRLAELAEFLDPASKTFQTKRIYYYNNESNQLRNRAENDVNKAFYKTINPYLDAVSNDLDDDSVKAIFFTIKLGEIMEMLEYENASIVENAFLAYIRSLPAAVRPNRVIGQNSLYVVSKLVKQYRRDGKKEAVATLLKKVPELYPQLGPEIVAYDVIAYSMMLRELLELVDLEEFDKALIQYKEVLQTIPDSLKSDKVVANNSLYVVSKFVKVYQEECRSGSLDTLLQIVKKGHPQIHSEVEEYYPLITSFALRSLINKAKGEQYDGVEEAFEKLVKSSPGEYMHTDVVAHNALYLFSKLVSHYGELGQLQSLLDLYKLLGSTYPKEQDRYRRVYNRGASEQLFTLIERSKEGDRKSLVPAFEKWVDNLTAIAKADTILENNSIYLFQVLKRDLGAQAQDILGAISLKLAKAFPSSSEKFQITVSDAYQATVIEMVNLIKSKEFAKVEALYVNYLQTLPKEVQKESAFQTNTLYVLGHLIQWHQKRGTSVNVLTLLQKTETAYSALKPTLRGYFFQHYSFIGGGHWNKKEWKEVEELYLKALPYAPDEKARKGALRNLDVAAYNQAVNLLNTGSKKEAKAIVKTALKRDPEAEHCNKLWKKMK